MAISQSIPLIPSIAIGLSILYLIYKTTIHPLFISPLRHIPRAHWTVPFPVIGDLWLLRYRYQCRNNEITYAAHQRCGPIVRLAFNEISVNCVDGGVRTIYAGGWEKHDWYPRMFASYGVLNMFSIVHHNPHSQKKRTMANIYSKSHLQSSAQLAANSHTLLTARFLPLIQSLADSSTPTDVHDLNNAFTMDFMSAYQFGISQSTNFTQQVDVRHKVLHTYHSRRDYEFYGAEVPWLTKWSRLLGVPLVPAFVAEANQYLEAWGSRMCRAADAQLSQSAASSTSSGNEPVVYKQFKQGLLKLREKDPLAGIEFNRAVESRSLAASASASDAAAFTQKEIDSEMLDHLGAGHETSAIALTYLYWELSRNPDLQRQLRAELLTLTPAILWPPATTTKELDLPPPKSIDALPLLHAIIMETLRLHTPIPGMEPRRSPANATLGPYSNLPAGIRVSSMPYTLHRIASVFPDPFVFQPARWLPDNAGITESHSRDMARTFWAFGSGGRMCIGSNLAMQEMKLIVAAIYSNYRSEVVDDDGIEQVDAYTTKPRANRLILKFDRVA